MGSGASMDQFDYQAKRRELLAMWQTTFTLFQGVVESAKAGETVLKASMAKEINAFMKMSTDILDKMEQEENRARLASGGGYSPDTGGFLGDPDLDERSEGFHPDDDRMNSPLKLD